MSFFSKFKQQCAEFFDKEKKTTDEGLRKRLEAIHTFDTDLKAYYKNVDMFNTNALCKNENGLKYSLQKCLKHTVNLVKQLNQYMQNQHKKFMHSKQELKLKVEALTTNIKKICDMTISQIAELKAQEQPRENARVFYDHYRLKMQKLEKTHMNSSDQKKLEKYNRNMTKFNEARKKYEDENRKLEQLIDQVQIKIEVVYNTLCLKFTKDVEAAFFIEINQQFQQLQDIEERMREIATQATQGSFGKVGQGLDLDVQF